MTEASLAKRGVYRRHSFAEVRSPATTCDLELVEAIEILDSVGHAASRQAPFDAVSGTGRPPTPGKVSFSMGGAFLRETRAEVEEQLAVGHVRLRALLLCTRRLRSPLG